MINTQEIMAKKNEGFNKLVRGFGELKEKIADLEQKAKTNPVAAKKLEKFEKFIKEGAGTQLIKLRDDIKELSKKTAKMRKVSNDFLLTEIQNINGVMENKTEKTAKERAMKKINRNFL